MAILLACNSMNQNFSGPQLGGYYVLGGANWGHSGGEAGQKVLKSFTHMSALQCSSSGGSL